MSESGKKQPESPPAANEGNPRNEADNRKNEDSADVERAVYDGMQDLRVKKPA